MTEILNAGPTGMAVLGLGAVGALVALALAGVSFTKHRVPLAAWVALPILVCIVGSLGAWSSAGSVFAAIEAADGNTLNQLALSGLWQSLTIDWGARWIAAVVLVLCAWLAGVGSTVAVGPAAEAKITPIAAGATAIAAGLGALGLAVYSVRAGVSGGGYMLAAVVLIGGLGVAFASARRSLFEHAQRVAGMRFTSAAAYVIGVAYAGQAVSMGAQMDMFGPNGKANNTTLEEAVGMWAQIGDPIWYLSWGSLAIAAIVAFIAFYNELGDIVQRFTLVDMWATFALLGGLATVRVIQETRTDALADVGTHGPARAIFDAWGTDLASATLTVEKKGYDGTPSKGGYGDVLVYKSFPIGFDDKGNPITKPEWRRTYAWDGSSWYADDSPLDCEGHAAGCTPPTINTQRPPLLAIGKGETATTLLEVAKTLPGKQFMLLLRRNDLDDESNLVVPQQLAHKQVGFVKIEVDKPVDLKTELWVDAGYKELFWGPTYWFGDDEDADGLVYTNTVVKDTEAPGVHVLISDKARVEGIATNCLTIQNDFESSNIAPADRWCSITEGDVEEWREKAMEVWEIPEPETVRTRIETKPPEGDIEGEIDYEKITRAFLYENGAIADCQRKAHEKALEEYDPDDPESKLAQTWGRMDFEIVINDRGRINGTYVDTDKSKFDNRDISACAAGRFRKLAFDELPPRPKPAEGEPKPEPPKVSVLITYDFKKLPDEPAE